MRVVRIPLGLLAICVFLSGCGRSVGGPPVRLAAECAPPAQWVIPAGPEPKVQAADRVFARFAEEQAVLLGETHDDPEHHRWQLSVLAGLYARRPHMILGLEMFPRRVQPALDRWVAGRLTEREFLAESDWQKVWGYEASLYLSIFQFARLHRIPMVALNVERQLVTRVGEEGWAAIPAPEREGVADPAPADPAYLRSLYPAFLSHRDSEAAAQRDAAAPTPSQLADPAFRRFVEGMLVWDRAMAQGIAGRLRGADPPLVVAIMGSGHVRFGYGVPHQLRDLGIERVAVALPWDPAEPCDALAPRLADAVFALPPRSAEARGNRPRLGISIGRSGEDIVVREVVQGSVAERAGMLTGDVIVAVAGQPATDPGDVLGAVRRQAPGTWLPIVVRRATETLELVARFPPRQ